MKDDRLIAEPVEGWRAWQLALGRFGPLLVPLGKGGPWPWLDAASARCWKHRRHSAPVIACTCGLYAVRDATLLRRARSPGVVGTVALWGRVVEHALGWRGEFAYPQRLSLVCHVCLFQRGFERANPSGAIADRDGSLSPLCEHHLSTAHACGAARFEVLPVEDILIQLTDAYAVERLVAPPRYTPPPVRSV